MRIIGVDPGTNKMGYSVIEVQNKKAVALVMGFVDLSKISDPYAKLSHIYNRISSIVEQYTPTEMALEAPFYGQNVQSMLKLGRAQGVAMAAALSHDIDVFEYAPRKIKIAITGSGSASKEQVSSMLQKILSLKEMPQNMDASDALAVALCHFYQQSNIYAGSKSSSWSDFVARNQDKIIKP